MIWIHSESQTLGKWKEAEKNLQQHFRDTAFVDLEFLVENIWSQLDDTIQIREICNYYYFESVLN